MASSLASTLPATKKIQWLTAQQPSGLSGARPAGAQGQFCRPGEPAERRGTAPGGNMACSPGSGQGGRPACVMASTRKLSARVRSSPFWRAPVGVNAFVLLVMHQRYTPVQTTSWSPAQDHARLAAAARLPWQLCTITLKRAHHWLAAGRNRLINRAQRKADEPGRRSEAWRALQRAGGALPAPRDPRVYDPVNL